MNILLVALPLLAGLAPLQEPDPEDVVLDFALELEQWVVSGEAGKVHAAFDLSATLRLALGEEPPPPGLVEGFLSKARLDAIDRWCAACEEGATFDLLAYEFEGVRMARFRYIDDEGFNYYEFFLDEEPEPRIVDFLDYNTGMRYSEIVGQMIQPLLGEGRAGRLSHSLGLMQLQKVGRLEAEGEHEEALREWEKLPKAMRELRSALALKMQIAWELDEDVYIATMKEFAELFGEDPTASLTLIDFYFLSEDWEGARACIDRLDATAQDPYLDYIRGNVEASAGNEARARELYLAVVEAEPHLEDPLWSLIAMDMEAEDFPGVARWLLRLEFEVGYEIAVDEEEFYAPFVKSDAYGDWLRERERRDEELEAEEE